MTAPCWSFYALGKPVAQGSKRHVGRGIMVESAKDLKPWRDTVTSAAFGAGPKLDGPIAVRMIFTVPRAKSARKVDTVPFKKPDIEKLARAVCDAITAAGLWNDDAQVADFVRLAKVYPSASWDHEALPVPGVVMSAVEIVKGGDAVRDLWEITGKTVARAWKTYNGNND